MSCPSPIAPAGIRQATRLWQTTRVRMAAETSQNQSMNGPGFPRGTAFPGQSPKKQRAEGRNPAARQQRRLPGPQTPRAVRPEAGP
jgi:hypothetical protein